MTSSASFIDLVVLDSIREHFVSGAILAVTTNSLDKIIWANAAGAQAFGNTSLVNAAGTETVFTRVQQRQILNGLRSGKANMVRVGADLVSISARIITIDDTEAVLLSAPQAQRFHSESDQAFGMIEGLEDVQSRAAILDQNAKVISATENFGELDIPSGVLVDLVEEVSNEADRLVKRPIESRFGDIPSAIAYLDDNRFLLMAIVSEDAQPSEWPETPLAMDAGDIIQTEEAPISNDTDIATFADVRDEEPEISEETLESIDHVANGDISEEVSSISELENLQKTVQRFVWKTDRNNNIIEASDGLIELIGASEEGVVGQEFQTVLSAHNVERTPIDALMAREDTWSGVNVVLDISKRGISVPVTLSALPQRDAVNNFSGFRGFGLIQYKQATPIIGSEQDVVDTIAKEPSETLEDTNDDDSELTSSEDLVSEVMSTVADLEQNEETKSDDYDTNNFVELADEPVPEIEKETSELSPKEQATFAAIREQLTSNVPVVDSEITSNKSDDTSNVVKLTPKATETNKPDTRTDRDENSPRFVPSAFAAIDLLPRHGNIDLIALDQLPLAIMLQRGDDIIYANDQLLNLTGFDDISDITSAGGLNALFEEPENTAETNALNEARAVMRLKTDKHDSLDAEAHIQVINFENSKALLLALVPLGMEQTVNTSPVDNEILAVPTTPLMTSPDAAESTSEVADLKAQIEELHGILDTATDGVILLDGVANIRSLNQSAEALFGYETEAVRGRPFTTLFAIESHRGAMEYLTALTDNGVASVLNDGLEVIGREQEGRFIPLFMTLGRLAGSNGYCAVLRDITHWKRAEENLNLARQDAEAASTQKTAFLARMSHEIRTPLNAIIGFSDLMLDERFTNVQDERSKEYLKDINKSGGLVLDLVNDLLDLTKIESGEQEMEFSAVSINELLRESVSMMQPKANQQRVIIRSSLNADLPEVVADARSIKQIALNLLSNAIRFTKAGGQVIASSAILDDGCVAIRIRDTGIGMTEEEIAHAMQPYKQVRNDDVLATKEGSGLGLPLTKAMVEGNRADMSITSTPDVGTIVEVIFPANRVLSE